MIVTPFTKPETYIACPTCGKGEHQVSHLRVGTATRWYCEEEECGFAFSLRVISADSVEVRALEDQRVKKLVTLRSEGPVTLVVEGMSLIPESKSLSDGDEYFYNEYTCPINYLREVIEVRDDEGKDDPHGIFKYQSTEEWRDIE